MIKYISITIVLLIVFSICTGIGKDRVESGSDTKKRIKELKWEMITALKEGDEERAILIKVMIADLKSGKEVSATLPEKEKGPSEDVLKALSEPEVKKIDRMLNKKSGEETMETFNKSQEDEYLARGLLLDGKKLLVNGEYELAKKILIDAYGIKPKDEEILHYYRLVHFPNVTVSTKKKVYSLLKEKQIPLNISVKADPEGLEVWSKSWEFKIFRQIKGKLVYSNKGADVPPSQLGWNGKDLSDKICPDGTYIARLFVQGDYFCKLHSSDYIFELKAEPPAVQLQVAQETFIAGEDDVKIDIIFEDKDTIASWKLTIINQVGELIRTFTGTAIEEEVIWDGKNDNGSFVSEGETLVFKISGTDTIGKKWESKEDQIFSDIKIVKNKIVLNNIEFDLGKAKLKPSSLPILDVVVELLKTKSWFDINIVGHTDSLGSDASNLKLSKARALSVLKYFIKQGIKKERLSSEGMGESDPIAPNKNEDGSDNPEGRKQNRRVEFKLSENEEIREAYYQSLREKVKKKAEE